MSWSTSWALALASSAGLLACCSGPKPGTMNTGNSTVPVFATTTVKCGTLGNWTISTGNGGGECVTRYDAAGVPEGGHCDDGQGNHASVDCSKDGGTGGCGQVTGSGSCTTARAATGSDGGDPVTPSATAD